MSTHKTTKGKRRGLIVWPSDHPSLVQFADLLKLRSLAYSTRAEYLRHVPPAGQHRVRYFGWLHPSAERRRLLLDGLLSNVIVVRARPSQRPDWSRCCPHCGHLALVCIGPLPRGPPP